jgi:hypothetical protein
MTRQAIEIQTNKPNTHMLSAKYTAKIAVR